MVKALPPPQVATLDDPYRSRSADGTGGRWGLAVDTDPESTARPKARSGGIEGARDIAVVRDAEPAGVSVGRHATPPRP